MVVEKASRSGKPIGEPGQFLLKNFARQIAFDCYIIIINSKRVILISITI